MNKQRRCDWAAVSELSQKYHDEEWGVPTYDDNILFEFLILEGAQAGLSWDLILKRRAGYRRELFDYNIEKLLSLSEEERQQLLAETTSLIKNRLKFQAIFKNAAAFHIIQQEYGSFSTYIWAFVAEKPIINSWEKQTEVPAQTALSEKISRDLKKRGFSFVGPTIMYSYMQAIGMINDHLLTCSYRDM